MAQGGDRRPQLDVVAANVFAGTVSVLAGNGDGTFRASADYPTGMVPHAVAVAVAVADVSGDGKLDLVVTNARLLGVNVLVATWLP
jgi:hypothetical protein